MSLCHLRCHRQFFVEVVVDDVEQDAEGDLSSCQVMIALFDIHSLLLLLDALFKCNHSDVQMW